MEVWRRSDATFEVVGARGDVDASNTAVLELALQDALTAHRPIVVDLLAVPFMDSAGLRLLVETFRALEVHELSFAVLVDEPDVRRLLLISGLDEVFVVRSSVEQARAALGV